MTRVCNLVKNEGSILWPLGAVSVVTSAVVTRLAFQAPFWFGAAVAGIAHLVSILAYAIFFGESCTRFLNHVRHK